MLIPASITLIALLSSYVIYYTYRNKQKITCMTGMMISMTNSMMTSIALGTILGTFAHTKDLTIPTIASITIGIIIGYLNGRPVSLMASLDGVTAAIMGGMMGSMLGVMLQPKSIDFMVYFIDILFVFVFVILIRLISEETSHKKQETSVKKPLIANPIVLVVLLVFMGVFVFGKGTLFASRTDAPEVKDIQFTETSSSIQTINVKVDGYFPNNLVVEAGKPIIINFKTPKEDVCASIILSKELDLNLSLNKNADNYVHIKPLKPGVYHYECGMGMFKGTITVK
ncbi:cupredoxin domain-containing protein [Gottfriedia acidiceleris]|uniref:Cupredoxin domain-containing protein n=1 Tax=Gottfriedia acidiceleris TaxID=371036 RepID=A0ABY4JS36_9BACI|nr:cupredoxin domain-containing protein [Gottfriedia acidiceleris]UPM56139.1 cupredoxin domain-containing protein [Gottfriedia acidiceleris]